MVGRSARIVLVSCLVAGTGVQACIWDSDTLAMERQRFPTALELITGKFLRHSAAFYHWRIGNRLARLKSTPDDLALHDDLAVAYDKTGQHGQAIAIMLAARQKRPGRYETEANLGSFYIHAGDREKGLAHIREALRINPDAHFGREKYQALLVEYVMHRQQQRGAAGSLLPLGRDAFFAPASSEEAANDAPNFYSFIMRGVARGEQAAEGARAIKGALGMMKFGNHESPILLEVVGDLLLYGSYAVMRDQNAAQLAARAYLMASHHVQDPVVREAYRKRAGEALPATEGMKLDRLERDFRRELDEARAWYAELEANEKNWVGAGRDADAEFARVYYAEPTISAASGWPLWAIAPLIALIVLGACYTRRRRASRA